MDFLDPVKKRAHRRRLFVGYILLTLVIGIGSLILIYLSYGYSIDRHTGQVIQNGLVFASAAPESADIYINGVQKDKTDTRFSLAAGQYSVELRRNGYRTWTHALNLEGGSIERLVYPKLFPQTLTPGDRQLYATEPELASQSPDRHWLLVQQPGKVDTFDVFDSNDPTKEPVVAVIPATMLTSVQGEQHMSVVEWATDNRHVLLLHTYSGGQDYLLLDRETTEQTVNLSKTFNTAGTQVSLKDKKYDQYYFYNTDQKTLSSAELKSKAITLDLEHVLAFKGHDSGVILYVTDVTSGKIQVKIHEDNNEYTLRDLPAGSPYLLDIAKYGGRWYMAVGATNEGKVYIYKEPVAAIKQDSAKVIVPLSVLKVAGADMLKFSTSTQYILAEHGTNFSVYDIENDRRFQYELKLPVEGNGSAMWMDSARLTAISGGKVIVFDYDGTNLQTLTAANRQPFFDRDYIHMYTVGSSATVPGRSALVHTDLKVKK